MATLAAGCFWFMEAIYESIDGVGDAVSGFAGGLSLNPTYQDHGNHTETIEFSYHRTNGAVNAGLETVPPEPTNHKANQAGSFIESRIRHLLERRLPVKTLFFWLTFAQ